MSREGALTLAILGLGSIGLRHAGNALAMGLDVVGFDPDPDRRAALEGIGGRASADRSATIAAAGAVAVCSPSAAHAGDLADAVAAGRHVLVEKPLVTDPAGVAETLCRADAAGLVVFVAYNLRFHPAVAAAREIIASGRLGSPLWARAISASFLPEWRHGRDHRQTYAADRRSGGVIFDVSHELDLMLHLLGPGEAVAAVAQCTGRLGIASDDLADIILDHGGGVQSAVHVDYLTRPAMRATDIGLSEGVLAMDLIGRRLVARDAAGATIIDATYPGSFAADYRTELQAFLASMTTGAAPVCTGREGLAVVRVARQARSLCGLPTP